MRPKLPSPLTWPALRSILIFECLIEVEGHDGRPETFLPISIYPIAADLRHRHAYMHFRVHHRTLEVLEGYIVMRRKDGGLQMVGVADKPETCIKMIETAVACLTER